MTEDNFRLQIIRSAVQSRVTTHFFCHFWRWSYTFIYIRHLSTITWSGVALLKDVVQVGSFTVEIWMHGLASHHIPSPYANTRCGICRWPLT